jgi:hypothetical protein
MQQSLNLFHIPFEETFERIRKEIPNYHYDIKKHSIELNNADNIEIGNLRLPLHLSVDKEISILNEEALILYVSIESGNAAICIMKGKQNIFHTTFSAYMSRKKQGFSQIKYLNKKGKSRAGSRVRLAATTDFFENINGRLTELFNDHTFDRIALNCNTTLMPYLYQSKIAPPFDKKDPKLYKIPLHIQQSNYTNLDAAIKKLMAPILFFETVNEEFLKRFI